MDGLSLAFLITVLRVALPLGYAALGELVAERAGVLNIGVEGMMLVGAFAAYHIGVATDSVLIAMVFAILASVLLSACFAFFVIVRVADPIVCGAALNILALGVTGTLHRTLAGRMNAATVAPQADGMMLILIFALVAIGIVVLLRTTRAGLTLRAVGESAQAAYAQGIPVKKVRWNGILFGGAMAGLAGASLVLWVSDTFVEGMTNGRGFVALVLVLFGGYRVGRMTVGALVFGLATALQFRLQALGFEIPYDLLLMLPYVLTLAVLVFLGDRVKGPADLARPFYG